MKRARTAAFVLALFAASACVISEIRTYFPLTPGSWTFVTSSNDGGSCFPQGVPGFPYGGVSVFVAGTSLEMDSPYGLLLPTVPVPTQFSGVTGHTGFSATMIAELAVSSACTLGFAHRIEGTGYQQDEEAVTLSVEISGTGCASFAGTTIDNIPFPVLSDPSHGTCAASVRGRLQKDPPFQY